MVKKIDNSNMEKLLKCVDRSDELSTWKKVNSKLEEIMKEKPDYSKKQIIEAQIASLESVINSSFGDDLSIACMLVVSVIALLGNLTTIQSLQDIMIILIYSISMLILVSTTCMLILSMFFHPRRKSKILLYKMLTYMLEELKEKKEKENVTETIIVYSIFYEKKPKKKKCGTK